jgi:hypothetical protein
MVTHLVAMLVLQVGGAAALGGVSDARYFPGAYFNADGRERLQRTAMETWPGPSVLLESWRTGELDEEERVGLLLGAAAFHDPGLLPLYREAIRSDSQRLRLAAAYGYRDLLADLLPDVGGGVSDQQAQLLEAEMTAVARTLRRQPLVAMWLQTVLASEGGQLPGYQGVVLERPATVAFQAVERLMGPEDTDLLVAAYQTARENGHRISLLQLIEGLTLNIFILKPQGARTGWKPSDIWDSALTRLDLWIGQWQRRGCRIDSRRALAANLARMGAQGVDPFGPQACGLWVEILRRGQPTWWSQAARRLYDCGGPWIEISVLRAESAPDQQRRNYLLRWYRRGE